MVTKLAVLLPLLLSLAAVAISDLNFTYNGFQSSNLALEDAAVITPNGLLKLTNFTTLQKGHAFYPNPIRFKDVPSGAVSSFTATFVFGITRKPKDSGGNGMAFVIAQSKNFSSALATQYLGIFSNESTGNNILAVELDTVTNPEFGEDNSNHVGIDINSPKSNISAKAGYIDPEGKFTNISLQSGKPIQVWIEYYGEGGYLNVTLAPDKVGKPKTPLLSLKGYNLSAIIQDTMYVGFSAATGNNPSAHYILGWSFKMHGAAEPLSNLPKLPRVKQNKAKFLTIGVPVILTGLIAGLLVAIYLIWRWRMFTELHEPWERDYGPHRFRYKDLYSATNGFSSAHILGEGGFGRVYAGVLQSSQQRIAVKVVKHKSNQDMRQFVSEIVSMGQLSHRNLVKLHGYCRRKEELLLVYEYMANRSLETYLHNNPEVTLSWRQRFEVIKDVATGLAYLHKGITQVVIHRDIKPGNVLLDEELRAKIADFGLVVLHDPGSELCPTRVIGTIGYMAPEYLDGTVTASTDVFAFGALLLEVASGRKPINVSNGVTTFNLGNWVSQLWTKGEILAARDENLGEDFVAEEVEMVLKLGLLCQSRESRCRPTMTEIVQCLSGNDLGLLDAINPEIESTVDYPFAELSTSSVVCSLLSGGR